MKSTICMDCINHLAALRGGQIKHLCKASPRTARRVDLVTGVLAWATVDERGRPTTTEDVLRECIEVNDGNCPMFESHGRETPLQGFARVLRQSSPTLTP